MAQWSVCFGLSVFLNYPCTHPPHIRPTLDNRKYTEVTLDSRSFSISTSTVYNMPRHRYVHKKIEVMNAIYLIILNQISFKLFHIKGKGYRPGVAHRVGKVIALLFHDRGTRRGWFVSSTPLPHFTAGKDQVPIVQQAGWAPGPVWTGGKSRPHRNSIPDRPAFGQSLHRLRYPAHNLFHIPT